MRPRAQRAAAGAGRSLQRRGPAPATVGATKSSTLSTRPSPRNPQRASGPPSSRSDWTPSSPSDRQLVGDGVGAARARSPRAAGLARRRAAAAGVALHALARRAEAHPLEPSPSRRRRHQRRRAARERAGATPRRRPNARPGRRRAPSSVTATLSVTNGRPSVTQVRQASFCRRASNRSATSTSTPAARSRSAPPPPPARSDRASRSRRGQRPPRSRRPRRAESRHGARTARGVT